MKPPTELTPDELRIEVAPEIKIVAFLQNQWFKNPDKVRAMLARHDHEPERREKIRRNLIHYALFAGCLTGRRLRAAFGDLCDTITWDEASREIGGNSSALFKADMNHIREVIQKENPTLILAFGVIAGEAVWKVCCTNFPNILIRYAPHPAARGEQTVTLLKSAATETLAFIQTKRQENQP